MLPTDDPVSAMESALARSCSGIHLASRLPVDGKLGPSQKPMRK